MTSKKEYQEKYNEITTVQEWIDLLNDSTLNYFDLTQALSQYRPGDRAFWKIAEISGDWIFDSTTLSEPRYNAADSANLNVMGSERHALEKSKHTYGYDNYNTNKLAQDLVNTLNLENIDASINVQPPGAVKNLHMDTLTCFYNHKDFSNFADLKFNTQTRQIENFPTMYRMLVALTDWQPGWMFQLGVDQWVSWKKGDVIAIDWLNVAHCTANASFVQRPLLKITASAKNNWIQECIDSGQIRKFTL
jgi:hypothetical protein